MNKTKMLQWIGTHHVGISSRTMWCALMGVANSETPTYYGFDTPYDWDDFSRCYDLVQYGEVTKRSFKRSLKHSRTTSQSLTDGMSLLKLI